MTDLVYINRVMGCSREPSEFSGLSVELEAIGRVSARSKTSPYEILISSCQEGLTSGGASGGPAAYRYHGKGPGMGSIGKGRSSASF